MHFRVAVGVAVVALATVACGDQRPRLPEQPTVSEAQPDGPRFVAQGGGFSTKCSFPTASQLAGSYFTNNDTARVVKGLIGNMKSAGVGTAAAQSSGFDIFVHVSTNLSVNTDVQTGSRFVNEIIKCMFTDPNAWPATFSAATPGPEDFTESLDATKNGAFEVRSSTPDVNPVAARLDGYSAVAPEQTSSWASVLSTNPAPKRVLFYGRASVDQLGVSSETFYNWKVVARNTAFDPVLLVGVCVDPFVPNSDNQKLVVRRQDALGASFLPFADAWFLTPGGGCVERQLLGSRSGLVEQLAARVFLFGTTLFGPRPLHARGLLHPGGLAGATGGVHTDYGPEFVDSVFLRFVQQPRDARVCSVPAGFGCSNKQTISPVKVLATWHDLPVGGVQITVVPVDNNGTPAEMRGDSVLVTGEDGTVTYLDLGLTKPGGYRLVTIAEVLGRSSAIVIPQVSSDRFNIRP